MRIPGPLLVARFVERPNRFVLIAEPEAPFDDAEPLPPAEGTLRCHLPNPGRIPEFRNPGQRWVLKHTPGANRRTQWRAVLGHHRDRYVVLDTHLTNPFVAEALVQGALPPYRGWTPRAEVKHGAHRFDFELTRGDERMLMEVKSVNLVPDRTARFPDAPTTRGRSHLRTLAAHARDGGQAAVLFVIARDDVDELVPNDATDPDFRVALTEARDAGVDVRAWTTRLDGREWRFDREVPVRI